LLERVCGASGEVKITAPFAAVEYAEEPTRFMASTLTKMLAPQGKLKGLVINVFMETKQYVLAIIIWSEPLHVPFDST